MAYTKIFGIGTLLFLSTGFMIGSCTIPDYGNVCFRPTSVNVDNKKDELVSLKLDILLTPDNGEPLESEQRHFVEGTCGYHIYIHIDIVLREMLGFTCRWNLGSTQSSNPVITLVSNGLNGTHDFGIGTDHRLPSSFRGIIYHMYFQYLVAEGRINGSCVGHINNDALGLGIGLPMEPSVVFSVEINGCPSGMYGVNCNETCSCPDGIQCHSFNGMCMCPKGLAGEKCDKLVPNVEIESQLIYAKWGMNLTLHCTAHGIMDDEPVNMMISWEQDGTLLFTSHFRIPANYSPRPLVIVHVIKNMTDALNGEYKCVVGETLVQAVNVTAIDLPQPFLIRPVNQTVTSGENITLNCQVRKNAGTIKWTRNSTELSTATEIHDTERIGVTFDDTTRVSTLRLTMVDLTDESVYRCYVGHTFDANDINFVEAYVTVVVQPLGDYPKIEGINGTNALYLRELDLISITCAVYNVKPTPKLFWTLGNNVIYNDTVIIPEQDGSFTIKSTLQIPASFQYNLKEITCLAESNLIPSARKSVQLNVFYKPQVHIEPNSIDISEGDVLTANCLGKSNPASTYRWECLKRNGDIIHQDGQIFKITDVSSDFDQSSLRCIAANNIGTVDVVMAINIRASGMQLKIILPICGLILLTIMLIIPAFVYIRRKKTTVPHIRPTQKKEFDVFISYKGDTEEETFVIRTLVPKLEEFGYRVCVHYKHFIAGKTIIENIIECISKSHMTMIVLSRAFVESEWCKFEYQSASTAMPNFENTVIPVMFDDVTQLPNLDKTLADLLKRVNYITWPRNEDNVNGREKQFWKHIRKALRPIKISETVV